MSYDVCLFDKEGKIIAVGSNCVPTENYGQGDLELLPDTKLEDIYELFAIDAVAFSMTLIWDIEKKQYCFFDPYQDPACKPIPKEESKYGFLLPDPETIQDVIDIMNGKRVGWDEWSAEEAE